MELGQYLKNLRKSKNITLREAAKRSGVSHPYLSQLENGKNDKPSPEVLKKLAETYDRKYEVLLEIAGYLDEKNEEINNSISAIKDLYVLLVIKQGINETWNYKGVPFTEKDFAKLINYLDVQLFEDRIKDED